VGWFGDAMASDSQPASSKAPKWVGLVTRWRRIPNPLRIWGGAGSVLGVGFPLEAAEGDDIAGAFKRYEAHRKPRTSVVQAISSANTWMKEGASDTSWLYGYDAWTAPLDRPAAHAMAASMHA